MRSVIGTLILGSFILAAPVSAATPQDDVKAAFEKFVAAQNAHDLKAVENTLLDSPTFLWVTRDNPIWGRPGALKRFESLYQGTWQLEPEYAQFRVVLQKDSVAQIFVPVIFAIGPEGKTPQKTRFLMNQTLVKTDAGWKVASLIPIPPPPPPR